MVYAKFVILNVLFASFWGPQVASAATTKVNTTGEHCAFEIVGEIKPGDFDRMVSLLAPWESQRGYKLDDIACLDSPGGNFFEGLKIAEYMFDRRIGTYVGADDECLSICAIIFMMGRKQPYGEEVYSARTLHYRGVLGFHRPYLTLDNVQSYSSADINGAFDFGIDGIFELMVLATKRVPSGQMIEPDLMRVILETPPESMYIIKKIEEALRWSIEIEGLPTVDAPLNLNFYYACENTLSSPVARSSEYYGGSELRSDTGSFFAPTVFAFRPLYVSFNLRNAIGEQFSWETGTSENEVYIDSPRNRMYGAACYVKMTEHGIKIRGFDGANGVQIGAGNWVQQATDPSYQMEPVNELSYFHPQMQFFALRLGEVGPTDVARLARCKTYANDGTGIDDDVCLQTVSFFDRANEIWVRHRLVWPSGNSAIIEIRERIKEERVEEGRLAYIDTPDAVTIDGVRAALVGEDGACVQNTASGSTLCVGG